MTVTLTTDGLFSVIERRGWHIEQVPHGWRAHHSAVTGDIFMSMTPFWLSLYKLVPTESFTDQVQQDQQLLLHTDVMFMAKYCRDHQGTLTLQVDIPRDTGLFDYALNAITRYGDQSVDMGEAVDRVSTERYFEDPPGIPPEILAYYVRAVEAYGWRLRTKPKGITWQLVYKGCRVFDAYITVTKAWTYFQIPLLPDVSPGDPDAPVVLFDYLLRVNQVLYMAKLGINESGQVVLTLDLPTQELDFDRFRFITRLLAHYSDLYAREIQIMTHADPRLMEYL